MDSNPSPIVLEQAQRQAQRPPSRLQKLLRRFDGIFFLTVFVPTLLAVVYFGVLASDVFISESRFIVRSPQRQSQSGLGALLQGSALSRSQDDTYSVHDFILSRDALKTLQEKWQVQQMFSRDDIDVLSRFPGLRGWDKSFEALFRHYKRHVTIEFDSTSSISVLTVRAYDAANAAKINEALLEMSEALVNGLNTRSRQDLVQSAEREVKAAEDRAKAAAGALSAFRSDRDVFDPERQGAVQLETVGRLRNELRTAESQLAQVRRVSPANPQIATLEANVQTVRAAIADENARVLGRQGGLSSKSPVYERLSLERTFADRQLSSAMAALDNARNEAVRKQLYLERLVQPNVPDSALEPRRLRSIGTVFLAGLMLWGIVSMVLASVREHTN